MEEEMLRLEDLAISFGGNKVFSGINMTIHKGEIFGIIGTNGAGKTTIFNIVCGVLKPTAGKVYYKGQDITGMKPYQISRMGIGRSFQLVKPFMSMTPLENVSVARSNAGKFGKGPSLSIEEIMKVTGLEEFADVETAQLGLPNKKNVEIARALACNPEIILFDEVSCGLSGQEIHDRMALMKTLAGYGITIVVIEHIMMFIKEICDNVAVLHAGSVIAEGKPDAIINDPKVIDAYLGGHSL